MDLAKLIQIGDIFFISKEPRSRPEGRRPSSTRREEDTLITKTSYTAIQSLMYVAQRPGRGPVPPTEVAGNLGCSASYLAKIHTQLAKAGILESHRGVKGGITLSRSPQHIKLLDIVEACQGPVKVPYCTDFTPLETVCGFHNAMAELKNAVVSSLSRWSLQDMASRPAPLKVLQEGVECKMACVKAPA